MEQVTHLFFYQIIDHIVVIYPTDLLSTQSDTIKCQHSHMHTNICSQQTSKHLNMIYSKEKTEEKGTSPVGILFHFVYI